MKTSFRFSPVVMAVVAAMATAAIAQPPPAGGPDSPPPGPGKPGSGYPKPLGRVELPAPEPPPPPHHRHYRSPGHAGDSTVVQVQRALKARGYYAGPVDGDAGAGTRAAIRGFRREHGLGVSSQIDGTLLRALRI